MALIAPSILAADFARLGEALEVIKAAGAPMVHVDVMDGHFVPEITVGQPVVASLRKATDLVLDVHLMVERPERYVGEFQDLGADRLSVQAEATAQLHRVLGLIRGQGTKAGVALMPATTLESVAEVLGQIDFLTILTANPGFESQDFLPHTVEKIHAASSMRADRRLSFAVQAEGAIGPENFEELAQAGADILVVGSAIFESNSSQARLAEMVRLAARTQTISKV